MFSFTNDATNAVGLSNFETAVGSTIYKRVSTFNHVFTNVSPYTIRIPNALLFPNQTGFTQGGAAVKIKLTSMGLSTAGSVVGGIEYREYVVLFCPGGTSGGLATSSRHLFVNENQAPPGSGSFATFISSTSVSTSNLSNSGNPIVVNNNMNLGLTVNPVTSLLPPSVTNNRCIIRGTIEVV